MLQIKEGVSHRPSSSTTTTSSILLSSTMVNIGESVHYLNIGLNLLITACIMLQFPNENIYDSSWKERGQCYILGLDASDDASNHSSTHNKWISTSTLCAAVLVMSGIGLTLWGQVGTSLQRNHPVLASRCAMMGQGNLSHGFGHFFVHMIGNVIPKIELSSDPKAIGYLLVLIFFWPTTLKGVMTQLSTTNAVLMGFAIIFAQILLDVPGELAFTFSQSIIMVALSLDQLLIPRKQKNDNAFLYIINAFYYLPLWPLMWLEVTQCTSIMSHMGGHLFYDVYISTMPFVTTLMVLQYVSNLTGKPKKSI